jgi:aspartate/methionine/tyrosine aminotransferase
MAELTLQFRLETPHDQLRSFINEINLPPDLIDLSAGVPNWELPKAAAAELADLRGWTTNPSARATGELMNALTGWLRTTFALDVGSVGAAVISTSGSKEGLASAISTILRLARPNEKHTVLIPDGSYHAVLGAALCANGRSRYLHIERGRKLSSVLRSIGELELRDAAAIVFPFPAEPSAAPETTEDLSAVLDIAEAYDTAIVADECMLELFEDARPASFLDVVRERDRFSDNLIVSSSLSKRSFVSALRSGCLITSEKTGRELLRTRKQVSPLVPIPIQLASAHLWRDQPRCERIRAHLSQSRDLLKEACDGSFEVTIPSCGLSGWISVDDDLAACKSALAAGVATMPARLLLRAAVPPEAGALRIALDGDHDQLSEALQLLLSHLPRQQRPATADQEGCSTDR